MKKIATVSVGLVLMLGCASEPVSSEPRPPVPSIISESEDSLSIHLSYPESWNLNDDESIRIEVSTNVIPAEILFSWRSPMGNEISRDSFLFARNVRDFEFVYAYVTGVTKSGEFVVRRTEPITLTYEGPRKMRVLVSRTGNQLIAIAVPWTGADVEFDGDPFLYMFGGIEPSMRDVGMDDVEWEMSFMYRFDNDEMEFDEQGNPIFMSSEDWEAREQERMDQMQREREERKASQVNELHYEWYLDGVRFPLDHYEIRIPSEFNGEIRLVVYGENWELYETVVNP